MISGLLTVARWDLQQRVRSRRLLVGWVIWMLALVGLAGFIVWVAQQNGQYLDHPDQWGVQYGPTIFGFTVLATLACSLVIVPVFSASAIVAERESATLATLQATTLTPGQIAGGKLVSASAVAAAFLAGAIPALGIAIGVGHIGIGRAAVCLLSMYIEMVLLSAIALGWSAIASRSLVSIVLSYLTVFVLTVGTLVAFAFLMFTTTTQIVTKTWALSTTDQYNYATQLKDYYTAHPTPDDSLAPAPPLDKCTWQSPDYKTTQTHSERFWWLLLGNPFAIVSDAAPLPPEAKGDVQAYMRVSGADPLAVIAYAVRTARLGEPSVTNDCFVDSTWLSTASTFWHFDISPNPDGSFTVRGSTDVSPDDLRTTGVVVRPPSPVPPRTINMNTPLWPIGLGANLIVAAAFFALTVRRISVPYGKLPKGQRVA